MNMTLLPLDMKPDIERAMGRLRGLLAKLDQAEACGVDCQQFRVMADELGKQLLAIHTHAFKPIKVG